MWIPLEEVSIPILKLGNYLITSPQISLHDKTAMKYKDEILQKICETKAKGLVLDVSAIEIVDSFLVRMIGEITLSAEIMGIKVVLVGLKPAVALTLVEMGFTSEKSKTARDLDKGLEFLHQLENQ